MGNLRSVQKAIRRIGVEAIVSSNLKTIEKADKLILPGVGHFARGMEHLNKMGVIPILNSRVLDEKVPILGICLGMQLMTQKSEEGDCEGLGWVDAHTIHFNSLGIDTKHKVPHVGWNSLAVKKETTLLNADLDSLFYFVHSYAVQCNNNKDILCETTYGINFHSGFQKDNVIGLQFHPEKSHAFGLSILKNFSEVNIVSSL